MFRVAIRHRPRIALYPYTTLFRSLGRPPAGAPTAAGARLRRRGGQPLAGDVRATAAGAVLRHHTRSEEQRLNSSHSSISYAVFCLQNKTANGVVDVILALQHLRRV